MKKKLLAVGVSMMMAAAALAGCGSSATQAVPETTKAETAATTADQAAAADTTAAESTEAAAKGKAMEGKLGIIVLEADHGWLAGVSYYAEQKCKELGIDYQIYTSGNVNDQASQIEEAIAEGCAAIVLEPHTDEVSVAAQKIVDANIPLILFDRTVTGDYTAYVAGDNPGIGTQSAKVIGDKLAGKGDVAVLNVPSSGVVSTDRVNAFKAEMAKSYPDIKLIDITADDFTQENGLKTASDALVANPHIDAIFSIDDESSMGILQAIKDAGRTDIQLLSGCGGCQAYFNKINSETGITLFTATYSPMMIQDAIMTAIDVVNGKSVEKDIIIPPTIVNKENVAEFLDDTSPY